MWDISFVVSPIRNHAFFQQSQFQRLLGHYTTNEDTSLLISASDLLANDTDVDGDSLAITSVQGGVNGIAALDANGDIQFTPDADYNGPASFTYTISDGNGGEATTTVSLDVAPVNDGPTAVDDGGFVLDEDTDLVISASDLLSNDTDMEGDSLTITSVQSGINGTASLDANGNVQFTPDADYFGPASFTYTISDGNGGEATATVALDVSPVDDYNQISGTNRSDWLFGTHNADEINGYSGNDRLFGSGGDDVLNGGSGRDTLFGGSGNDELSGGTGRDRLFGNSGNDSLNGDDGRDTLFGGAGNDELNGGAGRDRLFGSSGNDSLNGGEGRDTLFGGSGNDELNGGAGRDRLYGSSGDDTLNGGQGDDRLYGGHGADTFVFESDFGRDRITDFRSNDVIELRGLGIDSFDQLLDLAQERGHSVRLDFGSDGMLTLNHTSLSSLQEDDFRYV